MVAKCWINCHNSIFRSFNLKRIRFLLWGSNQIKRVSCFWSCVEVKLRFWNFFDFFASLTALNTPKIIFYLFMDFFTSFLPHPRKLEKILSFTEEAVDVISFCCWISVSMLQLWHPLSLLEMIFKFFGHFVPVGLNTLISMCVNVWV